MIVKECQKKEVFYRLLVLVAIFTAVFTACRESGTSCSHNWDWVATTLPTATLAGEETYTCLICGETGSKRPVPAVPDVISSPAISIVAPVNGGTPSTTATTTETSYNIGSVLWSPVQSMFLGSTAYTATVTLTAKSGYTFLGINSATINGQNATILNNTGSAVTLSYVFPATNERIVVGIEIITQPAKLTYTHGDTLDLAGLVVTLTYDDTTTENVIAANFAAKNITANPSGGNQLVYMTHNGQPVVITYGGLTPLVTGNLIVNKALGNFGAPQDINITYVFGLALGQ